MYPVSDATNRFYIGSGADLATEIFHVRIDRAIVEIVLISDDFFHKFLPFYNRVFVLYKMSKYKKFCLSNLYLLCTYCKQISCNIKLE